MRRYWQAFKRRYGFRRGQDAGWRHRTWLRRHRLPLLMIAACGVLLVFAPTVYTVLSTRGERVTSIDRAPWREAAIIFGAGIQPDGKPSSYLERRIETGVALYKAGKVDVLLMSGDNGTRRYDEPTAMGRYAEQLGVPHDHIVLDYAGYGTYDTCYRAHAIFRLERATLVTHGYHLPRAITTCNALGVESFGVAALRAGSPGTAFSPNYLVRELLSTNKAMVELAVRPKPVLGAPEPIN